MNEIYSKIMFLKKTVFTIGPGGPFGPTTCTKIKKKTFVKFL